jgi:hypothetical protein
MPPRVILPRAAKPDGKSAKWKNGRKMSQMEMQRYQLQRRRQKMEIPQILDEELLAADLNVDYSKRRKKLRPQMPKKQQWRKVKGVITERENAPKGWNPGEPDLMSE